MSENGHKRVSYEFDVFRLSPNERLLTKNGQRVPLTPRVMDLLMVLVENQGELVSKETLLTTVWAGRFVEDGNLNRTISTLRKKLGGRANGSDLIETVPKLGYRFIAPVVEMEAVSERTTTPRQKPNIKWVAIGVLLALAVVIVLTFYLLVPSGPVTKDGLTRLTTNVAQDELPEWSPDGKKIAFTSNRDGAKNIYVMKADGSNVIRLTNGTAPDEVPVWSPDGTKLLFGSRRDDNLELYIMNADGSEQKRLTFNSVVDGGPARFSADGNRIVFSRSASNEGGEFYNFDIYSMNIDGGDVRQLTTDPEYDAGPQCSPDGSKIAFVSGREKVFDVFLMNPDGSGQINLTHGKENQSPNGWTPDSRQIFYNEESAIKGQPTQLGLMNADGTNRRLITSFPFQTSHISYSPVAKKLVFASEKDGNYEIYTVDATNLINE